MTKPKVQHTDLLIHIQNNTCNFYNCGDLLLTDDLWTSGCNWCCNVVEREPADWDVVLPTLGNGLKIYISPEGFVSIWHNGKLVIERDYNTLEFMGPDLWLFQFAYLDQMRGPEFELKVGVSHPRLERKCLEIQKEYSFIKIIKGWEYES